MLVVSSALFYEQTWKSRNSRRLVVSQSCILFVQVCHIEGVVVFRCCVWVVLLVSTVHLCLWAMLCQMGNKWVESGGLKSEIKLVRKGCENDRGRHGARER